MCKNCRENKYILINLDTGSEGITTKLQTFGLKCKVISKKNGCDKSLSHPF